MLFSEDENPPPPGAEGASPTSAGSSSHSPLYSVRPPSSVPPPLPPAEAPLFCPSVSTLFLAPPASSLPPAVTPLLYPFTAFRTLPPVIASPPSATAPLISSHRCPPSGPPNIMSSPPFMSVFPNVSPPSAPPPSPPMVSPPPPTLFLPSSPPTMTPPLPPPMVSPPPPPPPPPPAMSSLPLPPPPPAMSPPPLPPPPPAMSPHPLPPPPPAMSPPPPPPPAMSLPPPPPPAMSLLPPPPPAVSLPLPPPPAMSPPPPPPPAMSLPPPPPPAMCLPPPPSPATSPPPPPPPAMSLPLCLTNMSSPPTDIPFPTLCAPTAVSPPPSPVSPHFSPTVLSSLPPSLTPPPVTLLSAVFLPPPPVAPPSDPTVFSFSHPSAASPAPAPPAPPPHTPSPCCSCSALLPRLLSAHRMEVRRLLRGALSSLNRRLDALERRSRRREEDVISSPSASERLGPRRPQTFCQAKFGKRRKGEEHDGGDRKRRRRERDAPSRWQEEPRSFVGRMAVTLPTGGTGEKLKLQDIQRTEPSLSSSSNALRCLELVPGRPYSSNLTGSFSPNHIIVSSLLATSSSSVAPMWRLSAAAVETLMSARGGAWGHPERPLKDWTAPPSLSTDHSYVLQDLKFDVRPRQARVSLSFSSVIGPPQKLRANLSGDGRRRPLPLLPAGPPLSQSPAGSEFADAKVERRKQVSQFRIRRSSPRETQLTPMGLPKMKRLTKKNFSLEEIYTNKNFNHSAPCRSLETIFEEPREKDGALLLIGQQRRRRILLFPDFTLPRKRKRSSGAGLIVGSAPRKRAAARRHVCPADDAVDLDVMLVERLSALEDFLLRHGLSCD
ncbi:uncharacterized protein wu:fi75a02 isoform X2 [Synchiropus splendidus]|uniref:uncharacterized protein wu:fi75a02 isoform X2 n=1 Tax=Synchiropus splendidus TaxID=270530 RepID=UPI00237E7DDC|nr:uncharacterized protein wu:fi75a02 isoform X2 [Synchiropus splendidus]